MSSAGGDGVPRQPPQRGETTLRVHQAAIGAPGSLEWLVERFGPLVEAQVRFRLGTVGLSQDVDDTVAEVWLVVLRKVHDLRPREGHLGPVLVKHLGTTGLNLCNRRLRDHLRHSSRGVEPEGEGGPPRVEAIPEETRGVLSRVAEADFARRMRRVLGGLPEDQRNVLVLRLVEQRTNSEIAQILHLKSNTVAARYKRALEALRARFSGEEFESLRSSCG